MKYSKNGTVFYTSTKTPTYPLLVDTALYTQGATLNNAVLAGGSAPRRLPPSGSVPVVWTSAVGVTVTGNSLTKTAANAWGNAGAVSTQQIASGDGYVEFTASETSTYRMLGLSNGNSNTSYEDIDFALYEYAGQIQVYESGALKGSFGSYAAGDKLRTSGDRWCREVLEERHSLLHLHEGARSTRSSWTLPFIHRVRRSTASSSRALRKRSARVRRLTSRWPG